MSQEPQEDIFPVEVSPFEDFLHILVDFVRGGLWEKLERLGFHG